MNKMDDGLDWLRKIRTDMARKCDYDPYKLGKYYRSQQAAYQHRIVKSEPQLPIQPANQPS